jgi:putative ABC transport system ATP-binding protein
MSAGATEASQAVVRAVDVHKRFVTAAGPIEVLAGVDLEVSAGETVAITGESGSGKSTLLSLLAGLDLPSSGALVVGGIDLARVVEADLAEFRARTVGIVFQHFHLVRSLTALENVTLPLELRDERGSDGRAVDAREMDVRAKRALLSVGLEHRHDHFPPQLSGGECQRVAIARALVTEPALLLADEPTGNLDEQTGRLVADLLFDLVDRTGTTLVLVTHNAQLANRCARSVALKAGRLHEDRRRARSFAQ